MLSAKLWNQADYEKKWREQPEVRYLAQSKGKCKMIVCPNKGDEVLFVLNKRICMRGTVVSDGFLTGTEHQEHSCHTGNCRPHTEPNVFARVLIRDEPRTEEIPDAGYTRKGPWKGQRTWARVD